MRNYLLKSFVRVYYPHWMRPDEYKCDICGRRFQEDTMVCPYCRIRFSETVRDEDEYEREEEEIEAWFLS